MRVWATDFVGKSTVFIFNLIHLALGSWRLSQLMVAFLLEQHGGGEKLKLPCQFLDTPYSFI
jgi:hypothetical protein